MADAAPRDQQVQRFEMYLDHPSCGYECCGGGRVSPEPDENGEWVKWADVEAELSALRVRQQALEQALDTIVRGFDLQIFERNIDHDSHPGWAMRLVPYIQALAHANALLSPRPSVKGKTDAD